EMAAGVIAAEDPD
ncbi:hypothetical protein A2U01_0089049, partial [Trifolium medium]|nr:hypothetical protein [Trifolium medium]